MKKSYLVSFVVAALFAIVSITPAMGGGKKKPTPAAVTPSPTITSVTANSVTVMENKSARTLAISQFTEISVNGVKATVADLKPGMTVGITLGTDASRVARIVATGK